MSATGQMDNSAPHALIKRSRQGAKGGPEPVQTLPGFMFTMLGASTPTRFFDSILGENVGDGLLGRPLIIKADPKPKEENTPPLIPVPADVIDALQAIRDIGRDKGRFEIVPLSWPIYDRQRVQWTDEGKARYVLLGKQVDAVLETEPPYEELYGRIKANSLVLATLHAISRDHEDPVVDAPDLDLGTAMVVESVRTTLTGLGDMTGGTPYGVMRRDHEVYVRKKGTVTVRAIGNAVRGYSRKERIEVLCDLEELGKVHIGRIQTADKAFSILPQSVVQWIA
jgi:hypothetical protein